MKNRFFFFVQVIVDVMMSLLMVVVVLKQKGVPAALSHRPERSNSVRYIIKVSNDIVKFGYDYIIRVTVNR